MSQYLDQLIQLSKCDGQISDFEPQIKAQKEKLTVFMQNADELAKSIEEIKTELEEIKSKKVKNEIHLAELKDKLDDIAKKNKVIKTEKEMKALQLEEEIAKEQIEFAHEEIVRYDDLTSSKEERLGELEKELAEEQEATKEMEAAVEDQIKALQDERAEVSKQRGEIVTKIEPKILTFYEKVKRWAKDKAVVPVKKQACYGCFMKLNDRVYTEVLRADEIVTCPHCGRILYKEEEEA